MHCKTNALPKFHYFPKKVTEKSNHKLKIKTQFPNSTIFPGKVKENSKNSNQNSKKDQKVVIFLFNYLKETPPEKIKRQAPSNKKKKGDFRGATEDNFARKRSSTRK